MPRHSHHHNGRGGGGGGGGGHPRHLAGDSAITCSHCDVTQPSHRFPKSALAKYHKKVARGDNPAKVNIICWACCQSPAAGSSSAAVRARAPAPSPAEPTLRGCCTSCGIDYPLTTDYFTKGDTRLNAAARRVCALCRTKQAVQADDNVAPDGYELVDGHASDDNIVPWVDTDDEVDNAHPAPARRIEDLDEETRSRARRALGEFGSLTMKLLSTRTLAARRRMVLRFVPQRVQLRQQKLQRIRDEKARLEMMDAEAQLARLFALRTVHTFAQQELPLSDLSCLEACDNVDLEAAVYRDSKGAIDGIRKQTGAFDHRQSNDDDDDSDDDVDVIQPWYLTDKQRVELLQKQRQLERDLELSRAAPQDTFSRRDLDPIIDDDLVRRFEQRVAVCNTSAQDGAVSFRMACMLRALDEERRQHPAKRFRESNM